jgi:flagellar assembly protein FliH
MGMEKKRFLFDTHNFDDGAALVKPKDDELPTAPPPPTYSEDEISFAKESASQDGFQKGKQEGFRESEEGFSGKLYHVCEQLGDGIQSLLTAEDNRQQAFQQETYELVAQSIQTSLPELMARGNFDEALILVSQSLDNYGHAGCLTIHVSQEYVESLETYFAKQLSDDMQERLKFVVAELGGSDEKLDLPAIKIEWENGGASRDPEALKENIMKVLKQALAQEPLNQQNEDSNQSEIKDE